MKMMHCAGLTRGEQIRNAVFEGGRVAGGGRGSRQGLRKTHCGEAAGTAAKRDFRSGEKGAAVAQAGARMLGGSFHNER
jgi:hypothetical protein